MSLKNSAGDFFLCNACNNYLQKGKLPPKGSQNKLHVYPVPDDVRLKSYLEEALISKVLLFMKIFSLKSSRMPAIKDKCIVVPLEETDILNTVESLPRLPSQSGIIDVQWKSRVGQKNAHLQAKVDPFKLFEALKFLKKCGNKHYSESMNLEDYKRRCEHEDPDGYNLLFGQDKAETTSDSALKSSFFPDDASEPILELEIFLDIQRHENSEQEYREKDSIRKYQIDYDESICMVEKYPEAMQVDGVIGQSECEANSAGEEKNQLFVIAPG